MPSHWSRRDLLAALGTASLAGCAGGDGESTRGSPRSTRQPTVGTSSTPQDSPESPDDPSTPQGTPDPPDTLASAWPVPGAEPGGSNYAAGATGPTEAVAPLWTTDVGDPPTAPVVAGETLYVGAGTTVHALDARTGDRRWHQSVPEPAETPWVVGDSVYVPTDNGVVALATGDGRERWQRALTGFETALVADHGVYALTDDAEPAVVALDAAGRERWRTAIGDPWTAHLFASDDSVFVSSGGSGTRPWRLAADTGDRLGDPPVPVTDSPYPRFYRDGTVYSTDFLPAAVDARPVPGTDGGHEWREHIDVGALGPLSAGSDHLYAIAYGGGSDPDDEPGLYALSLTDGSRAWSATDVDPGGVPAAADETVVVPAADTLYGLAPTDGSRQWAVPSDDVGDALAVVDDIVYTAGDGAVRALRPP